MYYNQQQPFIQDKAILRSVDFDSITSVHIEAANVGMNSAGVKAVPAGLFLAKVGGVNRYLPRNKVTSAVATSSPNVVVNHPELFKVGDELHAYERLATLTLGGTIVAGDKVYISYLGQTVVYELATTTVATEAAAIADALASSPLADYFRFAYGSAGVINVYTTLADNDAMTVEIQSTAGTLVLAAFADQGIVGTISSIDYANKTLVLSANATVALDTGAIVSVPTEMIYGLNIHSNDYTYKSTLHLNAITGARGVYKQSLPYLDNSIRALFPKMHIS